MPRGRKNPFLLRTQDEELLLEVYDLIYITREHVEEQFYGHLEPGQSRKSLANKALKRLRDENYLAAVPLDLSYIKSSLVYTLGPRGVEAVEAITGDKIAFDGRYTDRTPPTIRHILEVGTLNKAFKKAASQTDFFVLNEWVSERRSAYQYGETRYDRIEPDATILTEIKNQQLPFFLEWERSRQRPEATRKKIRHYAKYSKQVAYKKDHLLVVGQLKPRLMIVCPDWHRVNNMANTIKDIDIDLPVILGAKEEVLNDPFGAVWIANGAADPEQRYRPWEKFIMKEVKKNV